MPNTWGRATGIPLFTDDDIQVYPKNIPRRTNGRKNFKARKHSVLGMRKWDNKEFIAWDGEGTRVDEPIDYGLGIFQDSTGAIIIGGHKPKPQPYVLLANSKGQHVQSEAGLDTITCFEMILNAKLMFPQSIFVGFSFNYDVNQMLLDVPEHSLRELHKDNECSYAGYKIKWLPHKTFYVRHGRSKRSAIIYDVFGFFQASFLKTCEDYLGEEDEELLTIREGKAARESFEYKDLDSFILPYCRTELSMLVRIMNVLRTDLHNAEINPSKWHGPGAIADKVFAANDIPINHELPEEIQDAAQFAYAGGRFECFQLGRYPNTVWEYDIRSAYPAAATLLPDLSAGYWEYTERFEPESFGIWAIDYRCSDFRGLSKPQPLFCRSESGLISYPTETQGWYWTPEARLVPDSVRGGWVYRSESDRKPFEFVQRMYEQRRTYKDEGNSTQRALKLVLNSLYGKTAQTVGSKKGPPRWHQLEYAGFITSYVRAKIYSAMLLSPEAIIATETDAVFSTEPLDLPLSKELGDWELTTFHEICYLQSGFYYGILTDPAPGQNELVSKYRGMDRDPITMQPAGLPYENVQMKLQQGAKPLLTSTTRYIGLGMGLKTDSVWRSWEKKSRIVHIDNVSSSGKRYHNVPTCEQCNAGLDLYHQPHRTKIGGYSGKSYARAVPWRTVGGQTVDSTVDPDEFWEMNPDVRDFSEDMEKWQDEFG